VQNSTYHIYNASAGSGKTYTLAKAYLKIILSKKTAANYREILALTFTNKAVNEMKDRIISSLYEFGNVLDLKKAPPMFLDISKELNIDSTTLQQRAKISLKEILHNYAFFDISTIDKFTHRLIRTFAKDLKLPQNFEVILDTNLVLSEAVDRLVNKAGSDSELTKVLIAFALEKANEDKSWDITRDIFEMGNELLFKEKYENALETLAQKKLSDFNALKKLLKEHIANTELFIIEVSKITLQFIYTSGYSDKDFPRETLPNHFKKISAGEFIPLKLYANKLEENLSENKIVLSKSPTPDASVCSEILSGYLKIKEAVYRRAMLKNAYKNIVPLTVLNALQKEVKNLELERDEIPLATFNSIISKEIKNQPVPFIYERLGEKYRHYFIDEFQDTSELQWNNLIPLIGNALESEDEKGSKGSLLIVGDAKQAIYRWRGGKAEQFLDLVQQEKNPFVLQPDIESLPANYRSYDEVIKFNNNFFTAISPSINNTVYKKLFEEGNKQTYNNKKGGFVQLTFIEEEHKNENELYCNEVLKTIHVVLDKNHPLKDICILVRDKKNGVLLADFLSQNNIPIISSETLLLKSNAKVNFLIALLKYSTNSEDLDTAYTILYFLNKNPENLHTYIYHNLHQLETHLLQEFGFSIEKLRQSSVYDGFEQAIKAFNLIEDSDAYLTYLLDEVLDVEYKQGTSASLFLEYWEKKKEKLSISAPLALNAVQIMTVHKSKGLEFPIVIFPFANSHIYKDIKPKMWLPVNEKDFDGFSELLINKNKEVVNYSDYAASIYEDEQQKLELDAFNVLYVALTRAVKNLFIISKKEIDSKSKKPKTDYYSGLFINYLTNIGIWEDHKQNYTFGSLDMNTKIDISENEQYPIHYQHSYKERSSFKILTKSGMLWDTTAEAAIIKGNTIHHILSLIGTTDDINSCFEKLVQIGSLQKNEVPSLKSKVLAIIQHPKLKEFYAKDKDIKNEVDIITKNGIILRPDRIVFDGKQATIIDYKTGKRNIAYKDQIESYAAALKEMNYQIKNKIIVYIANEITPEFI
tara:strand:- start:188720 stop:191836 length:3117 start_codon:yes stop_codon:yes gene_type:complete